MTEKVLLEIKTLKTESGKKFKIQHGKRAFIIREQKGKGKCNRRHAKNNPYEKSNLRLTLENLENLYGELYTLE